MKLTRVVKAYTDADPSTQHQLAIPLDTIKQITATPTCNQAAEVWQELTLLAFFFALRSCEYLHVGSPQLDKPPEWRTHPLRKRNIRFIITKNGFRITDAIRARMAANTI